MNKDELEFEISRCEDEIAELNNEIEEYERMLDELLEKEGDI